MTRLFSLIAVGALLSGYSPGHQGDGPNGYGSSGGSRGFGAATGAVPYGEISDAAPLPEDET
jgi:hypothetical protein